MARHHLRTYCCLVTVSIVLHVCILKAIVTHRCHCHQCKILAAILLLLLLMLLECED